MPKDPHSRVLALQVTVPMDSILRAWDPDAMINMMAQEVARQYRQELTRQFAAYKMENPS